MKLSNNFYLSEFLLSQTASREGIVNIPSSDHIKSMKVLCKKVLQPIRDHYKKPLSISSGYRSPALNAATKGSLNSQHCKGEAADIHINGVTHYDLVKWISENLDFDQVILEFWDAETNSGWVHVSYSFNNRGKILRAEHNVMGKTIYKVGLPDV